MTESRRLAGNKLIEGAAIDWVMHLERLAGRNPVDRRYEAAFDGDIWSDPYTIEVKAIGARVRGFGLPLEERQVDAARSDPMFVLDLVEDIAQGDSRAFRHRRFEGDALRMLLANAKPRTYYEVPLPVGAYDAAPTHPSLAGGPVETPDSRPEWVKAIGATRASSTTLAGIPSPIATAFVEFERWPGPKLTWQETYGKTPIRGMNGERTCAEVEIVARLRGAGWQTGWIDTYGQAPQAWKSFLLTPGSLPPALRDRFLAVDGSIEQSRMTGGGRWDIVAWRGDEMLILEIKGAGDQIRPKQVAWLSAALDAAWPATAFGIVNCVARP